MHPTRLLLILALASGAGDSAARAPGETTAHYAVRMPEAAPMRLRVSARLPVDDGRLRMALSWPGDREPLASGGWPALVTDLQVRDRTGRACTATADGPAGWRLATPCAGPVQVDYVVDYATLASQSWPAPREAAYADAQAFVASARSAFVTTKAMDGAQLRFDLPRPWRVAAPWNTSGGSLRAASSADLVDNLFAFVRGPVDAHRAGSTRLAIVAFGPWQAHRAEAAAIARAALARYASLMPREDAGRYLMVLLPQDERAAESSRASFALTAARLSDPASHGAWRNMVAHEIFHAWNGWRLKGTDYAATQWFQEGFTEYMANTTLLAAGIEPREAFVARMREHAANAERLQTPLDRPGTRKGPPLYSAGALIALDWDARIRRATDGQRALDDVWRALWVPRADGTRPYAWPDLQAALESFAPGEDWQALHARHVAGTERLTSPRVEGAARAVAAAVAPRCRTVRDRCEGDGPRRRPEALRRAACPWAGRQTPT